VNEIIWIQWEEFRTLISSLSAGSMYLRFNVFKMRPWTVLKNSVSSGPRIEMSGGKVSSDMQASSSMEWVA
jgi:hypothetical protein